MADVLEATGAQIGGELVRWCWRCCRAGFSVRIARVSEVEPQAKTSTADLRKPELRLERIAFWFARRLADFGAVLEAAAASFSSTGTRSRRDKHLGSRRAGCPASCPRKLWTAAARGDGINFLTLRKSWAQWPTASVLRWWRGRVDSLDGVDREAPVDRTRGFFRPEKRFSK